MLWRTGNSYAVGSNVKLYNSFGKHCGYSSQKKPENIATMWPRNFTPGCLFKNYENTNLGDSLNKLPINTYVQAFLWIEIFN